MHANASLDEIVAFLDGLLDVPRYSSEEPDSNGLLFGAGPGVTKFAAAVNTSLTTIVGAAKAGAQLLVAHHPPWRSIDLELYDEKMAMLREAGISLYAAHKSLDCQEFGVPWALARACGVEPEGAYEITQGFVGVYGPAEGDFASFVRATSRALGVEVEAHQHAKTFERIGFVGGAGGMTGDLRAAREAGCDTYLSGEGSMYTRMYARETGMNLILGTHHATEAPGVKALAERIAANAQIEWEFIADAPDVF